MARGHAEFDYGSSGFPPVLACSLQIISATVPRPAQRMRALVALEDVDVDRGATLSDAEGAGYCVLIWFGRPASETLQIGRGSAEPRQQIRSGAGTIRSGTRQVQGAQAVNSGAWLAMILSFAPLEPPLVRSGAASRW